MLPVLCAVVVLVAQARALGVQVQTNDGPVLGSVSQYGFNWKGWGW